MPEITAALVKALRDRTGLPMMECKRALEETGGDTDKAVDKLRMAGKKTMESRSGRETSSGRISVHADLAAGVGAMIELQCESAPVAKLDEFVQLANDMARQLATGPGAATPDALLSQPCPSQPKKILGDLKDDLQNRIREVFNLSRMIRIDGPCGGYAHFTGTDGVLVEVSGGTQELAKDVAMHIAAMKPSALTKEDLDPAIVAKEREILSEAARKEGKPENIIAKMIEGRLRNFYADKVLLEQPFAKDDKKTVGTLAKEGGMKVLRFVRWELGKG